jgi:hypothetical protein
MKKELDKLVSEIDKLMEPIAKPDRWWENRGLEGEPKPECLICNDTGKITVDYGEGDVREIPCDCSEPLDEEEA